MILSIDRWADQIAEKVGEMLPKSTYQPKCWFNVQLGQNDGYECGRDAEPCPKCGGEFCKSHMEEHICL